MSGKLKTAVAGVGYLGRFHAQKYAAHPGAELVAVVDMDPGRAKEIAQEVGCQALTDHRELIGLIDAVSVAVTTSEHLQVAGDLLTKGIHCLVEKPIAPNLAEADKIIQAARKGQALLQVGHMERFNPPVAAIKEFMTNPVMIECRRLTPFRGRGIDVDVVLDLMIHDIDIVLSLVGEMPSEIKALGACVITDLLDVANARLEFPSGVVAEMTATRVSSVPCRQIQVLQPKSHIMVDCANRTMSIFSRDTDRGEEIWPGVSAERREFGASDPLNDEICAFIETINNGHEPLVDGTQGRQALEVALKVADIIAKGPGVAA